MLHRQCATVPVLIGAADIKLTLAQSRIAACSLFQLQHQMLTFGQEKSKLLTVFFLVQLFDLVEFQGWHQAFPRSASMASASASATLMPSTPAERIPPA